MKLLTTILLENEEESYSSFEEFLEYEFVDTLSELKAAAEAYGVELKEVSQNPDFRIILCGDHVFAGAENDLEQYSKEDFVTNNDIDESYRILKSAIDFPAHVDLYNYNEGFWEDPPPFLYHGTDIENVADIEVEGLLAGSETRGISNRAVGSSAFLTSEKSVAEEYGDAVFKIDITAMKRDGLTPHVEVEPDIAEEWVRSSLARIVGLDDYEFQVESGMDPDTVIMFGSIPAKYLQLL